MFDFFKNRKLKKQQQAETMKDLDNLFANFHSDFEAKLAETMAIEMANIDIAIKEHTDVILADFDARIANLYK